MVVGRDGVDAFVARPGAEWPGGLGGDSPFQRWCKAVRAVDWNRVLLEARGNHMLEGHTSPDELICGACVMAVLVKADL